MEFVENDASSDSSKKSVKFEYDLESDLQEETANMVRLDIEEKQIHENVEHEDEVVEEKEDEENGVEETDKNIIPKRIFQTHKTIEYVKNQPATRSAINSWRKFVPEFGYHFYTDSMCDAFMKTEMEPLFPNIYNAYRRLPLSVMRADLWRYCVVYKYGGIYTDSDTICKCNPILFTRYPTQLICAIENNTHLCNWTFAAPALSPVLKQVIELCIERILSIKVIKGEHVVHFLTGPAAFTDGIEKYMIINNIQTFKEKSKYAVYKNPTIIVLEEGSFNNKYVKHLFHGDKGWKIERDILLRR